MLSSSLLEKAPSPVFKALVTYSGHTEQAPARTCLARSACTFTGVLLLAYQLPVVHCGRAINTVVWSSGDMPLPLSPPAWTYIWPR